MEISQLIQSLRDELNQHNYNYYVLDKPTISDFEFDQKLKQLQELEDKHPEFFDENKEIQVTNLSERGLVLGLQASF